MISHPSTFLSLETAKILREKAAEAEAQQQLHQDQVSIVLNQNWFGMYLPKKFGGLEMTMPEIIKTEEGLAWADGSTAWVVTLCSGAAWFVGFLDTELSKEILADKNVCFAGSGAATGTAEKTENGYVIDGFWKYATGSHHATVFTANCIITENGVPLKNDKGMTVTRSFLMKRNEVTLHKTWKAIGMIATGSNSFEVKNLTVSPKRCFSIDPTLATLNHPVFQYPFLQLAESTLAVNLSGMAIRFLDLCAELFEKTSKLNTSLAIHLKKTEDKARQSHQKCRDTFYAALEKSWIECVANKFSPETLYQVSETSHALAQQSIAMVDELYGYCGLTAADPSEEINRVWRNLHTASQHSLFRRNSPNQ